MDYKIRELHRDEAHLLDDFLYEAIFIPEGMTAPPRSIIQASELQVYVADFGARDDDMALLAESGDNVIGAVWTRIMDDYGHIDNDTPSLAISLYKEYRGYGIGTAMLREMLCLLKQKGYKSVSLSVQKANYAVKLYQRVGFQIVDEHDEEYIMACDL
ncbi:MAG: GNAT family N-acetyltransferase [Eubacteriales bacterium]|nr:GNAT family N-acetyltransferase [Eubacteriales bacterium]